MVPEFTSGDTRSGGARQTPDSVLSGEFAEMGTAANPLSVGWIA